MKFDRFIVKFALMKLNGLQNVYSNTDVYIYIYNYSITCMSFATIFTMIMQLQITIYSGTCLIRHFKGLGKCVGLYRMSEYSGFILANSNTFEP
jgi:hypothetical protein